MEYFKKCSAVALILVWLIPVELFASGYSTYENHQIWQVRLAAGRYAAQEAQKKCSWASKSSTVFSDQLPSNENVSDERLFSNIMAMISGAEGTEAIK